MPKQTKSWRKKELIETNIPKEINIDFMDEDVEEKGLSNIEKINQDDWYWGKSYLDLLRLDLLFFNILKLKHIDENSDYINIKKFITQEDIHAMDLNWSIIEKRIFYNIELGNLIIKKFDENEIADKIKYDNFVKKCRINNLKPEQLLKLQDWKKIIDKNKYLKHFLEIKITKNWLTRIDEINREIKDMVKNNTRLFKNVKKIQKVIDNSPVYASIAIVIGCLWFVSMVLFSWQDLWNVNPNMQSANILDKDWVDWFYKIKWDNADFEHFKNYFEKNFQNESSLIKDLKWNTYSKSQWNDITIFKVQLLDEEMFFKLDKSNNNISIERIYEF